MVPQKPKMDPSDAVNEVLRGEELVLKGNFARVEGHLRGDPEGIWDATPGSAPRTHSESAAFECWSICGGLFVKACVAARTKGDLAQVRELLQQVLVWAERAHGLYQRGVVQYVSMDRPAIVYREPFDPSLLLPDLYSRLWLGLGRPSWFGHWSTQEAADSIQSREPGRALIYGELVHSVRAVWAGDSHLGTQVQEALGERPIRAPKFERGLKAYCVAVPTTARILLEGTTADGVEALRRQLEIFARLDRPEPDSSDPWVAYSSRGTHKWISLDWAAVAFCILRPQLQDALVAVSPFLPIDLIRRRHLP